jgi:hypothetical protein
LRLWFARFISSFNGLSMKPAKNICGPRAWKVQGTQVYPVNDLREHSPKDCWCNPIDDEGLTVHNSLDGRELYEEGVRLPA